MSEATNNEALMRKKFSSKYVTLYALAIYKSRVTPKATV